MRDELGKGSIWVWGLDNSIGGHHGTADNLQTRTKQRQNATNAALALRDFAQNASIYVPLALPRTLPPSINIDRNVLWHTAGLFSAAAESAALPTRLTDSASARTTTLQDWDDLISGGGRRRVANLSFGTVEQGPQDENRSVDSRMRGSYSKPKDESDDDLTKELDKTLNLHLFPEVPTSITGPRRGKAISRRHKTFARIDSMRFEATSPNSSPASYDSNLSRRDPIVET